MTMLISLFFVSFAILQLSSCQSQTVTIDTKMGTIKGLTRTIYPFGEPLKVRQFLGVPYAEPPVGELRFQKPLMKQKVEGLYDATSYKSGCLQLYIDFSTKQIPVSEEWLANFSNDCLFLNIFTPDFKDPGKSYPVMILMHGGGFVVGMSNLYGGHITSAYTDVIVVSVNYRLGLFGFLSTGDANLPGNYGLWDQHMAIRWVYENIAAFGGDPGQITLLGGSAGGASVIAQALYPGNKGLIKRIIPQSGSITCPWAYQRDSLINAKRMANIVGCPTDVNSANLASCLRQIPDKTFMDALNNPENKFRKFPLEFVIAVDGEFMPLSMWDMLHSNSDIARARRQLLGSVDVLTGLNEDEGFMMMSPFVGVDNTDTFKADRSTFEQELVPEIVRVMYGDNIPDSVNNLVISEYTDWNDPDSEERTYDSFVRLSSDYVFNSQTIDITKIHAAEKSENSNTYLYLLTALPSVHLFWMPPTWKRGPVHADEWPFILGYDSEFGYTSYGLPKGHQPEEWETELSKIVMKMWTNFAKSGDPNAPEHIPVIWPKYTLETQQYLNISGNMRNMNIGKRLFERGYNFWTNALPELIKTIKSGTPKREAHFCDKDADCQP